MINDLNYRLIHLDAIKHNVRVLRAHLPEETAIAGIVKSDAYGHGIVQCASAMLEVGIAMLCVARPDEGIELREAGIEAPILVLGATTPHLAKESVAHRLIFTVCDVPSVHLLGELAKEAKEPAKVHIKLETGMNRIGCSTLDEVKAVMAAVESQSPWVTIDGAYTHFADADNLASHYTEYQLERFIALSEPLPKGILLHCANSAFAHRFPNQCFNMVRAGISLYGYAPVEPLLDLKPAMEWKSVVTFVKKVPKGACISYGCTYTAPEDLTVATFACGYGDGYHRTASGKAQVVLHGKIAPVLGRICMDQMMADVSHIPNVKPGDTVTMMGREGDATVTAEDIAGWVGTIPYEILLASSPRVKRYWLDESENQGEHA